MRTLWTVSTIALALISITPTALAQQSDDATRSAARALGEEGIALLAEKHYAPALEKFERALAMVQVPTLAVRAARCLEKLGRLVEAAEKYRLAEGMRVDPAAPPAFQAAQSEALQQATSERKALLARIPTVEIVVEGAPASEAQVWVDGRSVPAASVGTKRPLDPGRHRIEARRGEDVATRDVMLTEGAAVQVVLGLRPRASSSAGAGGPHDVGGRPTSAEAPEGSSTQRTAGWVGVTIGGVGVAAGLVAWALAVVKRADLDRQCEDATRCPASAQADVDTYDGLRTFMAIGLIAGGVTLAGSAMVLVTAPRPRSRGVALDPWVGPGSAGLRGRF